jgi:hypothetical protein
MATSIPISRINLSSLNLYSQLFSKFTSLMVRNITDDEFLQLSSQPTNIQQFGSNVQYFTANQLDNFNADILKHMTQYQVKFIYPETLSSLTNLDFLFKQSPFLGLNPLIFYLTPEQLNSLPISGINDIFAQNYQIFKNNVENGIYTPTNIDGTIKALNNQQISKIDVEYLTPSQIRNLTNDQISNISIDSILKLSNDQLGSFISTTQSLTMQQLRALALQNRSGFIGNCQSNYCL